MVNPDLPKSTRFQAHRLLLWIGIVAVSFCLGSSATQASVVVYDRITTENRPIFFKVLTKGRILPMGGQRVTVNLDGVLLKKILSGGDGMAYLEYKPRQPGVYQIEAQTPQDRAQGILLVLKSTDRAVVIDVVGGLFGSPLGTKVKPDSRESIETLGKTYALIYVYRFGSIMLTRQWLTRNRFPRSVVLEWKPTQLFDMFERQGIQVAVAIGAAAFINKVPTSVPHRFCFDNCSGGEPAVNWESIIENLNMEQDDSR